jgi:small-conductance mechanosensitive channel
MEYQTFLNMSIWQVYIFGNNLGEFTLAAILFVVLFFAFKLFQKLLISKLSRLAEETKTDIDDVLIDIIKCIRPPFYSFFALYLSLLSLNIPATIQKIVTALLLVWVVYLAIQAVQKLINYTVRKRLADEGEKAAQSAVAVLGRVISGVLWVIGILFILSNLGINVSSMLAGIGIGGIAIAIAAQNILGDLFSSFAIYFDKPFIPGDFIIVGQHMGVVERVGIKTTRIKALQGEEIVISNQELTSGRVQNFKKMQERRVVFNFGLVYQTPLEKLKLADELVKKAVESTQNTRLDRVHFIKFDSSALSFEVVYYVLSPDYNQYMDIQQEINFKVKELFEKEGLEMAYPTQTIYLANSTADANG